MVPAIDAADAFHRRGQLEIGSEKLVVLLTLLGLTAAGLVSCRAGTTGGRPASLAAAAAPAKAPPPPAVQAACDLANSIAAQARGATIRHSNGRFGDETLPEPVLGCRLEISGLFSRLEAEDDASVLLRDGFSARGWQEIADYSADGKDGTSFAFRSGGVGCLVRGRRDGGADGEPEIPPADWYEITVICTSPAPPPRSAP